METSTEAIQMTLVDQIRLALERQNKRIALEVGAETTSSHMRGFKLGADSRTEMILKLVAALEKVRPSLDIAFEDIGDLYYMNVKSDLDAAIVDLKKELGIE
jgi:hypothetical protein